LSSTVKENIELLDLIEGLVAIDFWILWRNIKENWVLGGRTQSI